MTSSTPTRASLLALGLAALLALACGSSASSQTQSAEVAAGPSAAPPAAAVTETRDPATATIATPDAPVPEGEVVFTGSREEIERFIRHYQTISLTPEQERTKVAALATIPAPCCDENPLATCCCPCNMAKAAWGLSAWLITEKGYGVEEVHRAAGEWLAAANPGGFTGDACFTGGCGRPIHQNGCGGMDHRNVL